MSEIKTFPTALIILDGYGITSPGPGNAIALAKTPNLDKFVTTYPTTLLDASGEAVGLPAGNMGNSEVGHMNIGAGRVVYQDLPMINESIKDGSFYQNAAFLKALEHCRGGGTMHLIGLFSPGGVHSMSEHAYALLKLCKKRKMPRVMIHVFLDGRDTLYNGGRQYVKDLQDAIENIGLGKIATVAGRFYAMDRDNHWERTQLAYQAIAEGDGPTAPDPITAIDNSYAQGVYDEQMVPTVIRGDHQPKLKITDHDAVVFFNFRPDRARQLTKAFVLPGFIKFHRARYLANLVFVAMTEYELDLPMLVAYPPKKIDNPLGQVISEAGLKQLRAAETEKYAHVTFFFNGGRETPFSGEDRILVPSPRIASYDKKPAMSAKELTDRVLVAVDEKDYDLIVLNFANLDMVGHTANIPATMKAVEVVDQCLGQIVKEVLSKNGQVLITADHGNAEHKIDIKTGEIVKAHSTNPVPLILIKAHLPANFHGQAAVSRDLAALKITGKLGDIAPTILKLINQPIPPAMTGQALFGL